ASRERRPSADETDPAPVRTVRLRGRRGSRLCEIRGGRAMKPVDFPPTSIVNTMTIDVEDYFQVGAFADRIPRDAWDSYACRVERNVDVILALLAEAETAATFFTLGWIA